MPPCPDCNPRPCWAAAPLVGGCLAWCDCMIARRSAYVNTTECNLENCTKHYGVQMCNLHKLHRIGPDRQPGQPGSRTPAKQQPASPAAARQPGSSPPARQQAASPAADRQPGSRPPARQQITGPAAMVYTRLRGRAHTLRAALMFLRACADAQVLRARPRAMRVRKRESWVGL